MTIVKKDKKLEDLSDFYKQYAVIFKGYVQSFINPEMLIQQKISTESDTFKKLKEAQAERISIFYQMELTDDENLLAKLDSAFTANEFYLQNLWGFEENIDFHKFWEAPKCTCPKLDNNDQYPTGYYSYNQSCPIHKNRFK